MTQDQYVLKQQQLKERAEHIKHQEAEAEAERAEAEVEAEEDDDCAWADGCDDKEEGDGKEL